MDGDGAYNKWKEVDTWSDGVLFHDGLEGVHIDAIAGVVRWELWSTATSVMVMTVLLLGSLLLFKMNIFF